MSRKNFFVSYHHQYDFGALKSFRQKFMGNGRTSDYGFKDLDLGEESKYKISRNIQRRIWSSSILIVLIGSKTGESEWIDWEIWYALRKIKISKIARRVFKPKGILVIYLPVARHSIPRRLETLISSGYAVKTEFDKLMNTDGLFFDLLEAAYNNRKKTQLIDNSVKPQIQPQNFFSRFMDLFLG